jgi:hypothetical protein
MSFKVGQKVVISKEHTNMYTDEKRYRDMFFYNPEQSLDELPNDERERYMVVTSQPPDKIHVGTIKRIFEYRTGNEYQVELFKTETCIGLVTHVEENEIKPTCINLPEGMEEGVVIGKR